MARGINQVNLMGRMTRDPEERTTTTGSTIVSFSLAVDRGDANNTTDFFDITVWNKLAEIVMQYCKQGSKVHVSGRLQLDRWESDGQKKTKVSVTANDVVFLETANRDGQSNEGNGFKSYPGVESKYNKGKGVSDFDATAERIVEPKDQPINLDDIPF